jgi:vacuolar-type H+-ATPase subunit I/STV1
MKMNKDVIEAKLNNCEQRIKDVHKALDELRTQIEMLSEMDGFQLDVHQYYINKDKRMAHAPIHIAGNNHTLEEAEEFHSNFGDLINRFKESQT